MQQIVLPPPADLGKATGWIVTSEGDACECASEEDMKRIRELEHAMNRLFLFIVTVLPVLLGAAAMADAK